MRNNRRRTVQAGASPPSAFAPARPKLDLTGIRISVAPIGGGEWFDVKLTRVPSIGEIIQRGCDCYQVEVVQHVPLDDDGYGEILGTHAYVTARIVPEPPFDPPPRRRLKRPRSKRGKAKQSGSGGKAPISPQGSDGRNDVATAD